MPYLRRYPVMVALSLGALLIAALSTLVLPFAIRLVIDQGFVGRDETLIDGYFQLLLGIVTILAMASALRFYCAYWLGERLVADLKRDVFQKLISFSGAFYDQNHSGEIMSRMAADTTLINTAIRANVSQALRNMLVFIGGLVMMVVSSPSLSFMVICAIPIVVLPLVFYGRLVRRLSGKAQDVLADLNQYGSEALLNVRTVQAFGAQRHVIEKFSNSNEQAVDAGLVRTKARAALTAIAIFLVMASIVFILWYGAHDVMTGAMSPGALVQFMLYAVFAGGAMGALSEVWGEVAQAAGAADRLTAFLDLTSQVKEKQAVKKFDDEVRGQVSFSDVSFSYPTRPENLVLDGINFTVNPGEQVAIVGGSGTGKSTLLQLLLRFYDPDEGQIQLDGVPIENVSLDNLRAQFALVPQEPALFDASVYDNIAFARPGASKESVIKAAKAAQADEFINRFDKGYDTFVGEGGQSLSGGQRQRLALARAILHEAPILLLDEATSALDAQNEEKVQTALQELMAERTSFIIAHRLSTVMKADRILVLDQGRIVEEGTHAALMEQGGVYAKLAQTQLQADG